MWTLKANQNQHRRLFIIQSPSRNVNTFRGPSEMWNVPNGLAFIPLAKLAKDRATRNLLWLPLVAEQFQFTSRFLQIGEREMRHEFYSPKVITDNLISEFYYFPISINFHNEFPWVFPQLFENILL